MQWWELVIADITYTGKVCRHVDKHGFGWYTWVQEAIEYGGYPRL